jgi:unsaturated chondroitin disaccharide hydrolase
MYILKNKPYNPDELLLSREEIMGALELLFRRMDTINSSCVNGFPLYSPAATDQWIVSQGGSWVGGFWSGCWWLRARITGSVSDQHKASEIYQRLSKKTGGDSINRSLIFWYGASLGDSWFGDASARKLVQESIVAIAAFYDPEMNCIPLGTDMGGGKEGSKFITIDTLASLIQLLNSCEHSIYHHISRCHADTLLAACQNDNGAFYTSAHFSHGSFRPTDYAGIWSRGQAWAMLGLSRAAAQWGEPYLTYAHSACEYWRSSRPEPFPPNLLNHPSGPCDPSSSVIASLAMLSLADLMPRGNQWRINAHQQITAIVRSQYFIGLQENNDRHKNRDRTASGIFWGCCYKTNLGRDELVESAWGNFFLMAALCILVDAIEPRYC